METYNTNDEIVCPYCGHVIKATPDNVGNYDLEFNDEEFECEKCEKKTFIVQRRCIFSYETFKKE